jgi:hypothetical protein
MYWGGSEKPPRGVMVIVWPPIVAVSGAADAADASAAVAASAILV